MQIVQLETPSHGVDVELLAAMHNAEFGGSREFDVHAVGDTCYNFTCDKERKQVNCWIAYDEQNAPIGYLAATIHRSFSSYRSYAIQEMWYVIPAHRTGRASTSLLLAYERWALMNRCERIYTQVEHDADPDIVYRIMKFLSFLGYKKQGYIAVKVTSPIRTSNKDDKDDPGTRRELGAEQAQVE